MYGDSCQVFFPPFPSYKYVSPDCSFSALAADTLLAFRFNWFSQFLGHLPNCVCVCMCVINMPIVAFSDKCILKGTKGVLMGFSALANRDILFFVANAGAVSASL